MSVKRKYQGVPPEPPPECWQGTHETLPAGFLCEEEEEEAAAAHQRLGQDGEPGVLLGLLQE